MFGLETTRLSVPGLLRSGEALGSAPRAALDGGTRDPRAASGRVLVSTDARMQPGSMLRIAGLGDALLPLRAAGSAVVDHLLPEGGRVVSCGATSLALFIET